MKLSAEQISVIRHTVDRSAITIQTLKDDVLDHLCCVTEYKLESGKKFEVALSEALRELAPDGLDGIQRETTFLLNSTNIIRMKKMIYLVGFVGAVALTGGMTFKILHMRGADELFMAGYLLLFLIFIPLSAIEKYKIAPAKAPSERLKIVLGVVSAVVTGLAGIFKIQQLAGADFLLMAGAIVFSVGFLPLFFVTMYRKSVA